MKLVTFGCSWIWGDELEPSTAEYRNSVNIGGLINKDYKFDDYINYGNNGASNERIILQIMEYKKSKHYDVNDFILVGLSGTQRKLDYLNYNKIPFTIPVWHEMLIPNDMDDSNFRKWFLDTGAFLINSRNDAVRYSVNIQTIKSLLSQHSKYIVFQSIDKINKMYDSVEYDKWSEIRLHHDVNDETFENDSTIFFDKEFLEKEIKSNLLDTQVWINFKEKSWFEYLEELHIADPLNFQPMVGFGQHPNEFGIKYWYDNVLKSYIEKILI